MQSSIIVRTARLASRASRTSTALRSSHSLVVASSISRSRTRCITNTTTIHRYDVPGVLLQNCRFSTDADQESVSLSDMSPEQLKALAMKYARQDSPLKAQEVLERLKQQNSTQDLSTVSTTVMDSWIKYQNQCLVDLKDSVQKKDAVKEQLDRLKEVCQAAESAGQILDTMAKPSSHHIVAVLKTWANAVQAGNEAGYPKARLTRGIPQRMQHLVQGKDSSSPTTEAYNQILKAWSLSGEHLRGTMAEQIFQKIEEPNGESFRWILRAWCWSQERRCAFTATGHYMRMMRLLEISQSDMEPTMDDYHVLFRAWTKAEDKNAPSKVQTVLGIMDNTYRDGYTALRPDEACYRDALLTMSRRVNVPEVGELADKALMAMKERAMVPDSVCYGAAILAWKNVATSRETDDRELAAKRALELLREMTQAYYRTTKVAVKPTTENYNHALEALTVSKSSKAVETAETLLTAMEEAEHGEEANVDKESGSEQATLHPDAESFKLVLDIWRSSKLVSKVPQAAKILDQMKERHGKLLRYGSSEESMADVFSAFIRVCANPSVKDEADRMKVMKIVLKSVEDMRKLDLQPNARTYTALLEACNNLLPEGKDRQLVLENLFQKCCQDGYVDQQVLEQFQSTASTYLYSKLVVSHSQEVENMKVVPESWTRNIKEYLVNTKEGRKVLPLSIEGKFTFTVAAGEYKMRKLRRRGNQRMLQGGRMK